MLLLGLGEKSVLNFSWKIWFTKQFPTKEGESAVSIPLRHLGFSRLPGPALHIMKTIMKTRDPWGERIQNKNSGLKMNLVLPSCLRRARSAGKGTGIPLH